MKSIVDATYRGDIRADAEGNSDVKLYSEIVVKDRDGLIGGEFKTSSSNLASVTHKPLLNDFLDICGYTIYKEGHSDEAFPFKVTVLDPLTGQAKIQLESDATLDIHSRPSYDFEIAAHDCVTQRHAAR